MYIVTSYIVTSSIPRWSLCVAPDRAIIMANSYFEVLGENPPHIKLTEVNGDAVEEEVSIASSIVDGNKALEVWLRASAEALVL